MNEILIDEIYNKDNIEPFNSQEEKDNEINNTKKSKKLNKRDNQIENQNFLFEKNPNLENSMDDDHQI